MKYGKGVGLKVNDTPDGLFAVRGEKETILFQEMIGGIGLPDREQGYFCVVGRRADGKYHCLWESQGGLWELSDAVVQAQEVFPIHEVWMDNSDEFAVSFLRGLHRNAGDGGSRLNVDSRPVIRRVSARTESNFRSALEKTRGIILEGRLFIHEKNCPVMMYSVNRPLADLLNSAAIKALVWTVCVFESFGIDEIPDVDDRWYGNICRKILRS
jgi:hypothetical protein